MGVKNLWDILESCKKKLPLHHLQNKRVCVDLSCWMVQLQNINKSYVASRDKFYLISLFHRLKALIALNCSLIFVTDGSIPSIKLSTYKQRLGSVTEVTSEETNSHVSSLRRNMGSVFSYMIKEAKVLGMALGIPCLDGLEEAEAQCALLNSESLCDGCFTSDSDAFLFGARTVYRDICLGEGGYVVCYEMAEIEKKLGFGRNSLIALALLLGSDYSPGVCGFGPETAREVVKSIGDGVILQRITSEGLAFAKKKELKKQGQILNGNANKENNLFHKLSINNESEQNPRVRQCVQVINAYLKPRCHSPDSEAVHRLLFQYPFQRNKLQQMCAEFFDWAPEKTDEYILPKIAERNLRRFINLRKTSSEVGLQLPLYELPVTCPVSAIIKRRQVQGRECFEVAWEEMEGLKTSTVPADLIESACPEKIMEFEVRKAEVKKPKRNARSKNSESSAAVCEVNQKLQDLLLDIEAQSNEISSVTLHRPVGPRSAEAEVINIMSPSLGVPASKVVKTQQVIGQQIDAVDLSESETEASPEHARKARELRLFIASIKDDAS